MGTRKMHSKICIAELDTRLLLEILKECNLKPRITLLVKIIKIIICKEGG